MFPAPLGQICFVLVLILPNHKARNRYPEMVMARTVRQPSCNPLEVRAASGSPEQPSLSDKILHCACVKSLTDISHCACVKCCNISHMDGKWGLDIYISHHVVMYITWIYRNRVHSFKEGRELIFTPPTPSYYEYIKPPSLMMSSSMKSPLPSWILPKGLRGHLESFVIYVNWWRHPFVSYGDALYY